jgi:SAM-dependent methyltransferase
VGIGYGNFAHYIPIYETYVSIDVNEKVIDIARNKDDSKIYLTLDLVSDDFNKELSGYNFNTVICINVLEHVADHQKAFKNMIKSLSKDGYLLLFVPAHQFLFNDMDKLAGHYRRYTKKLCNRVFQDDDYELIKIEYFNPIGALGWWANKYLRHERLDSDTVNNQIRYFDKYLIYLSKAINPFTKNFFGQSLVCVYKKNKYD